MSECVCVFKITKNVILDKEMGKNNSNKLYSFVTKYTSEFYLRNYTLLHDQIFSFTSFLFQFFNDIKN